MTAPLPLDLRAELQGAEQVYPRALLPLAGAGAARFAAGIPPVFRWMVLEGRLTGEPRGADLLVALIDGPGERARVAAEVEASAHRSMEGIAPLVRAWRDDPALEAAHVLWVEYDHPFERSTPLQMPSIDDAWWGRGEHSTPAAQVTLAAAVYQGTFGEAHEPSILMALLRCIDALNRDGVALSTASLRPRGIQADRLFVQLPRHAVLPWLRRIGWPGDLAQAEVWLRRVVHPMEPASLQIEVDPAVRPYLGIEPRQTRIGDRLQLEDRTRFLQWLVAEGRTDADRAQAVSDWQAAVPRTGPAGEALAERRTLHLKCVLGEQDEPEVKAYLGTHLVEVATTPARAARPSAPAP